METLLQYKTLLVASWLVLLFAAERLLPAALPDPEAAALDGRFGWRRLSRNLGLWAINGGLSVLIILPVSAWAASVALQWRPDWWSGSLGLALDIVILDFWIYLWHRANHSIPFLWRFHEVHHLDRFLDVTTSVRFHFGEVLLSAALRGALIFALGMPIESIIVFEIIVLAAAAFQHANLRLPHRLEKALSMVVITPSIHWVHHRRRQQETDSNYGVLFSVWDRVMGTLSPTPRTLDMPIGVQEREERGFAGLIVRPSEPA